MSEQVENTQSMSFGKRLRNLRRQKGWTQKELAAQLYITSQAVSKWEQDVSEPDVRKLRTLSELFGVKVDQLVGNPSPIHSDRPIVLFSGYTSKKVKTRYGFLTLFSSFLLLAFTILVIYTYWLDELTWHFPLGFLLAAGVDLALLWKVAGKRRRLLDAPQPLLEVTESSIVLRQEARNLPIDSQLEYSVVPTRVDPTAGSLRLRHGTGPWYSLSGIDSIEDLNVLLGTLSSPREERT